MALLATLLFRLFPFEEAAAAYLARQVTELSQLRFGGALAASLSLSLSAGAAMLLWGRRGRKREKGRKRAGKREKDSWGTRIRVFGVYAAYRRGNGYKRQDYDGKFSRFDFK